MIYWIDAIYIHWNSSGHPGSLEHKALELKSTTSDGRERVESGREGSRDLEESRSVGKIELNKLGDINWLLEYKNRNTHCVFILVDQAGYFNTYVDIF